MPATEQYMRCDGCGARTKYSTGNGDVLYEKLEGWFLLNTRWSNVQVRRAATLNAAQVRTCFLAYCVECDPWQDVTECGWCNEHFHDDHEPGIYVEEEGVYVCLGCYEDNGFTCEDCDRRGHIDDARRVDEDRYVCGRCITDYSYCESCDYYTDPANIRSYDDIVDYLETEGREEEVDDLDDHYEYLCTYCADDRGWPGSYTVTSSRLRYHGPPPRHILNYTYRPQVMAVHTFNERRQLHLLTQQQLKGVRLYGWELEVESNGDDHINDRAGEINSSHDGQLFYCKSDSSIRNGFEIVSHPGTFDYWTGPGREILEVLFADLTEKGYTSYRSGRCGLHIHTNRSAVTRLHAFNLARFMHATECRPKLKKLSGRTSDQMDGYARLIVEEVFNRATGTWGRPNVLQYAKQVRENPRIGDRSNAINLSNAATVELRLFRGSLKIDNFMSAIQFYRTLLDYTNPTTGAFPVTKAASWLDYRNFVEDYPQPKAVKELKATLQEKGI